jgi:hypothetical protein
MRRGRFEAVPVPARPHPWFIRAFKTERLPERIQGLALTTGVVARQLRVDSRKFPPLSENLFSANVEFDQRINLVLYEANPNRGTMFIHVAFTRGLAFTYAAWPGLIPTVSAASRSSKKVGRSAIYAEKS